MPAESTGENGKRWRDRHDRVYVIAEAGVNHNGDVGLAHQLVEAAGQTGADAVKFQTFVPELLVTESAAMADYQARRVTGAASQRDMIANLALPPEAHFELRDHAVSLGLDFLSTAFDAPSLDLLLEVGMPFLKVPSGEITNLPFLRLLAASGLDIVVSTGMATLDEVRDALECLGSAGVTREQMTVLHCTTAYPAPMEAVNLRAMTTMAQTLEVAVGYSDHTLGIEVATAAVALGGQVIEKHLTLRNDLPGPDHAASLEPAEFAAMTAAIRNVTAALGDGVKRRQPAEESNARVARRSIVAATDIAAGELLTEQNLTTKRPGTGISPMRWDEVVGTKATRAYRADELIT